MAETWGCADVLDVLMSFQLCLVGRKAEVGADLLSGDCQNGGELGLEKYIYALERAVETSSGGQEMHFCVK